MACCGKDIIPIAGTLFNITTGYVMVILDQIFALPPTRCNIKDKRLSVCRQCYNLTQVNKKEYAEWINQNGGIKTFVQNINRLEEYPPLPKQDKGPGRKPFCRICKCNVEAKVRVAVERCPLNLWPTKNNTIRE